MPALNARSTLRFDPPSGEWLLSCPGPVEAGLYVEVADLPIWRPPAPPARPLMIVGADPEAEDTSKSAPCCRLFCETFGVGLRLRARHQPSVAARGAGAVPRSGRGFSLPERHRPMSAPPDIFRVPEPSESFDAEMADGAIVRVRRHGNPDGPRLVMAHGNGFAIDAYYPFWRLLTERYDLAIYDQRNHGRKPAARRRPPRRSRLRRRHGSSGRRHTGSVSAPSRRSACSTRSRR